MSISKRDLETIRASLVARKRELEEQLKKISQEKVTDDQVQDPGDQALSSTMELLRSSLHDQEAGEYKRVAYAIEKIDDGSYGICVDCGEEVSEKRLKMYPDAARCLVCQEALEDREG